MSTGTVPCWCRRDAGLVYMDVHVQPGAAHNAASGLHGERLKIRLAAPALEGRANSALVAFIAARLGVPKRSVRIVAGEHSRSKRIVVDDPDCRPELLLEGT